MDNNDFSQLAALFTFSVSPIEIIVRGTAVYWFLFLLFRFVMRRDVGSIAIADVLLLVMIADASQNAMAGDYKSIADGCLLVTTIAGWNLLIDWSSFHIPVLRRFAQAKPLLLVSDGRLIRANMRREFITLEELEEKLREGGVKDLGEVRKAYLESDGQISLLLKESADVEPAGAKSKERPGAAKAKRPRRPPQERPVP